MAPKEYDRIDRDTISTCCCARVSVLVVRTVQSLSTYYKNKLHILQERKVPMLHTHKHSHTHTHTHTHTQTHTHTHTHTHTLKFQCYLQEELVVLVRMTGMFVATHMTKCKSLWNSQVCNMFGSSTAPDPKTDIKYDTKCCDPQRVCDGMSH